MADVNAALITRLRQRTHADMPVIRAALAETGHDEEAAVAVIQKLQIAYLVERSRKPEDECREALQRGDGDTDKALKTLLAVEEVDYVRQRMATLLASDLTADEKLENLLALVWRQNMNEMDALERTVALVGMLHNQLRQGGLQQYFFVIGAHMVPETLDALQTVGANHTALVLREAALVTAGERSDTLESLDAALAQEPELLAELALDYLQAHR